MIIHPAKKRTPDKGEEKSNRITGSEVFSMFKKHILSLLIGIAVIGYVIYKFFGDG